MNITIYQINESRDENRVMFQSLAKLARFQGSTEIDSRIYDKVFSGEVPSQDLEQVYQIFNLNHPKEYRGRSLSVSDVVEILDDESGKSTFYFCDSFGFAKVDFHPEVCPALEQASGKIRVLLVEPGKVPRMIEIDETLQAMQAVVEGDIEEYMPFEDEVALICNEEGKVNGMKLNRAIYSDDGKHQMLDIIAGKFFLCYAPYDAERFQSLPDDLAQKYEKRFRNPERFIQQNGGIVAVPIKPASKEQAR
ncbi:MAG: DUF3846 domain-containing protein [Lachnospiraceae bacterium]|nr:DUF3846 domain-containing protein [Lachnospiraceae bacterium]